MTTRLVVAVAAALLCTSALAQEAPADSASTAIAASASTPTAAASVAASASTQTPAEGSSVAAAASSATPASAGSVAQAEVAEVQPGDADAGQQRAAVCGACHGPDGNSSVAQYPRLAGQSERYIVEQLVDFKSGARVDPVMAGMAAPLSKQDMHDLGAYFAEQTPKYGVADEELVDKGKALYDGGDAERGIPACMACHGPAGAGNAGTPFPHLAGQHAEYVQKVLHAWKDGDSWGDDTYSQIMPTIASHLTDEDILAVSNYIEGLHAATSGSE